MPVPPIYNLPITPYPGLPPRVEQFPLPNSKLGRALLGEWKAQQQLGHVPPKGLLDPLVWKRGVAAPRGLLQPVGDVVKGPWGDVRGLLHSPDLLTQQQMQQGTGLAPGAVPPRVGSPEWVRQYELKHGIEPGRMKPVTREPTQSPRSMTPEARLKEFPWSGMSKEMWGRMSPSERTQWLSERDWRSWPTTMQKSFSERFINSPSAKQQGQLERNKAAAEKYLSEQKGVPFQERMVGSIKAGSRVTFRDRFGEQRTGRAVMKGPSGWVLNMGGKSGRPHVVDPNTIISVATKHAKPTKAFKEHQASMRRIQGIEDDITALKAARTPREKADDDFLMSLDMTPKVWKAMKPEVKSEWLKYFGATWSPEQRQLFAREMLKGEE